MMQLLKFVTILLLPLNAFSDPQPEQVMKQKNSHCVITSKSGEYSLYSVTMKDGKKYHPKSDGISGAKISPSGKYAVLSSSEVALIDLESNKIEFGLVVLNCETGNMRGYRKGKPSLALNFSTDDAGLTYKDLLSGSEGKINFSDSETPAPK